MAELSSDPRVLRAIAHPVRARVLAELSARDTVRAADLATAFDLPANQISFHLRQLAKYGLIEEAPEEARDKRERVWRAASREGAQIRLDELAAQPGGEAAVAVFRDQARARGHHLIDRIMRRGNDAIGTVNDASIRLTDEETEEFRRDLAEVFLRWRDKTSGDEVERTTYSYYSVFQPYPPVEEDA